MSLTIKRGKDKRVVHALVRNLADLPDGITLMTAELVKGGVVKEGALIGRDASGVGHLVKTAKVTAVAGSDATQYKVEKGSHFKVGDFVCLTLGGAAYAVTAIDRDSSNVNDTITVETTIGEAAIGAVLKQAKSQATGNTSSKAELKHEPIALLAESYNVEDTNLFVAAVTIGQFKEVLVPAIDAELKAKVNLINFI